MLESASPRLMNCPSPPAPMKADSVAMPTPTTAAVRMPATITGNASGSSTRRNCWAAVIPTPRAASRISGAMPRNPVTVLRTMGSSA